MDSTYFTPETMVKIFGMRGDIAPRIIGAFEKAISDNVHRSRERDDEDAELIFRTAVKEYLSAIARITAWRILAMKDKSRMKSFNQAKNVSGEMLRAVISDLKSGRVFQNCGIRGFPPKCENEPLPKFRRGDIEEMYRHIIEAISAFSPPADPVESDIFKPLYLDLMPRRFRHQKGEYYTPDWLADRVLELAGYDGDPAVRLLDPSCGSGTFLIRGAAKLRQKCKSMKLGPAETVRTVFKNIVGFDLDPTAAETASVNLLLAVADLLPLCKSEIRLPVYCADSILAEKQKSVPADLHGAFDVVAGNPPWINWETIPDEYRRKTKPLWERHGLFPHSGMDVILGKSKKDLSMLMTYQVMEDFLAPGGTLAFIITRATLKSAGSGQGFRRFQLGDTTPIRPVHVDDLSAIKPFGSVGGSPLIIVLKKGERAIYPTPYAFWKRKSAAKASWSWPSLEKAKADSILLSQVAEPVDNLDKTSPWITAERETLAVLRKMLGHAEYTAYAGVYSGGANGVYWMRVIEEKPNGLLLVENIAEAGKRAVKPMRVEIEPDYLYPLLRASEVECWRAEPKIAVLVVQDAQTRRGIDEKYLKGKSPRTWQYLSRFETLLRSRAAWKRFFTTRNGDSVRERAPFYSMFAVGRYTFAPFKVVWPRMASSLDAAVVGPIKSMPVLPQETITFIPFDNRDEAHFVCALINSTPVRLVARSYSQIGGKGFAAPHLLRYLRIMKFNPTDRRHQSLAFFSMTAHEKALIGSENLTSSFQDELDDLASEVLGLTKSDLRKIKVGKL